MKIPIPEHLSAQYSPDNKLPIEEQKRIDSSTLWVCPVNSMHVYNLAIVDRMRGQNCPYCAGKRILPGFNDLATTHPALAAEWHPTKNGDLTPQQVSKGSIKSVWWYREECGHEWTSRPNSRTASKAGCAVCSGNQVILSTSLASTHPDIARNWCHEKNENLEPTQISRGSHKKVWWVCDKDPEHPPFRMPVKDRVRGHGCPVCGATSTVRNRVTPIPGLEAGTLHPELVDLWDDERNEGTVFDYKAGSNKPFWWKCANGHSYRIAMHTQVSALQALTKGCQQCWQPFMVSTVEKTVLTWMRSMLPASTEIQTNVQGLFSSSNHHVDIYIPSLKLGVEYNGLYWHSELQGKTRHYHENKYLAAKTAGIQLIQIWEDDWRDRQKIMKQTLLHKMGLDTTEPVYARKTTPTTITTAVARSFMTENHIQGFASGSYYLGLTDVGTGTLVAVMVLKQEIGTNIPAGTLSIIRFATSTRVPGGFTKLLKFAEKEYTPNRFITFADHCISNGVLYEQNGFVADKELPPDYMYVVQKTRKHKFGYRIKKFRNDPTLKYEEGLTEKELATLNGFFRIWDAGKTRYVKTVTSR